LGTLPSRDRSCLVRRICIRWKTPNGVEPPIGRAFIALLMCLGALAGCTTRPIVSSTPPASGPRSLVHGGITRTYVIRVPANAGRVRRLPLVVVLHGGGGNAASAERVTGFTEKAESEGFVVAYPEGTSGGTRLLTWNAGHCCGYAMGARVDDVGFIGALIDTLIAVHHVDPARVYVTGMSNGAMMAHRAGIELSHKVAAIAPVVGTVFGDERRPEHPVSAIMFNGALDVAVPHRGGAPGGRFPGAWDGTPARPSIDQGAFWASANGCAPTPDIRESAAVTVTRYHCPPGRGVELYLLPTNGHAWPGGQAGSALGDSQISPLAATSLIWDFFRVHPK
jgi:polyhydroxybutyrate depolymerase